MSATAAPATVSHRMLDRSDMRTLALSSLGGALEFYDFIIFVFYAKLISELFFPRQLDPFWALLTTYGIFAAGYFFRPVGGIVMAHFGDRLGRKRMFTLSILLMALPTFAIGLLPTYAAVGVAAPLLLLAMRILQGVAIGGEIPAAWTFVSEHVPQRHVGLANGVLCAGLNVGILIGSLVALGVERSFSPADIHDGAWRLPFLLGGVLGLVTMYLRRWLQETPVFREMQARRALCEGIPLKAVLTRHVGGVVLSMLLTWVLTACIMVALLSTPQLMSGTFHLPRATAFTLQSWAIVAGAVGCVLVGGLCDRFGVGNTLLGVGLLELGACTFYYTGLGHMAWGTVAFWYVLMGAGTGMAAAVPAAMVRSFPAPVRLSGVSFSYNVCYAVCGGVTFPLITVLSRHSPIGGMYYLWGICLLAMLCGLVVRSQREPGL
ncbi:MFS transporter [Brachymonas sp.]|uniref:MFS transporter n=1 Tax=Brachymonas sp. TaxID=1936292 RepID=UPI0035B40D49